MFKKLGVTTSRFPIVILFTALLLVIASVTYGFGVFNQLEGDGFNANDAESTMVKNATADHFSKDAAAMVVLFESKDGTKSTAPEYQKAVASSVAELKENDKVGAIHGYFDTQDPSFVSKDGTKTYIAVAVDGTLEEQQVVSDQIRDTLKNDMLNLRFGGNALINHDVSEQIQSDLAMAETISFALLSVLLVLVFRGFIAALIPLFLGAFAVLVSFLVLRVLANFTSVSEYAINIIILLGLGLAIDYSLLIVSRFREELAVHKGDKYAALHQTMHTAGHTVFFSGLTVVVCLLALTVFPLPFLRSMGQGGAAAVGVALFGALVVLPAALTLLGTKIDLLSFGSARRSRRAIAHGETVLEKRAFWAKAGAFFMRRPILTIIVTLSLLAAAGLPLFHIKLATPDQRVLPASSESRQVTEVLQNDFVYTDSPISILYQGTGNITNSENIAQLYNYTEALKKVPGVTSVESLTSLPGNPIQFTSDSAQQAYANISQDTALQMQASGLIHENQTLVKVNFAYDAKSTDAQQLVGRVRDTPHTSNTQVYAGGYTAELVDQLATLIHYLPYAVGIMMLSIFILLFLMLGSVVIPIKAMLQNILSLSVSFGALVWIFQDGHLAEFLHMNATGDVDATQPIIIFAIAFGLSMDYSVFLYGRIKEQYDEIGDTREAILRGLQKTGAIITSAAALLFVVVVAFATSRVSIMQQIGVGLAIAIVVDAFIVRMVLVPATMVLFGKWNWWAPKSLKKLHAKLGLEDRS